MPGLLPGSGLGRKPLNALRRAAAAPRQSSHRAIGKPVRFLFQRVIARRDAQPGL
jgi:hypothetical protein